MNVAFPIGDEGLCIVEPLLAFVSSQRGINGRLNEGHTYIDNIASYDHDTAANITCHTTK